uniref:hypothetical protein n=1 Tax=Arthrobacter sp. TaxID=1667 RepID=UPI000EB75BB1|nr:hypothetical protein [Arthrobacter sp.]AXV46216.1 hypothetical protein pA19BH1_p46 [Arthrobacter sp.]
MARRERAALTDSQRRTRKIAWASAAGVVVLVSVVGLVGALISAPKDSEGPQPTTGAMSPSADPAPESGSVVDAAVTEFGWLPEPITTDAKAYGTAAAIAGSTYDTTLATRKQFLDGLGTWHTLDPRYDLETDQQDALASKLEELNRRVIVPETDWDAQASNDIAVTAKVDGKVLVDYDHLSPQPGSLDALMTDGYHLVTTNILATYSGRGDVTYQERYAVSVQVLCGNTAPVESSDQTPADCKLIRFFPETRK